MFKDVNNLLNNSQYVFDIITFVQALATPSCIRNRRHSKPDLTTIRISVLEVFCNNPQRGYLRFH
jgi:hypothetical protein